jgi:hypothetical protein
VVIPVRRIVLWFLSTLSVLVLLFGYNTSTGGGTVAGAPASVISGSASGTSSTTGGTSTGSGSGSGSGSDSGSSSGSGSTSGSGSGSGSGSQTVTGDVAQTEWGPVQVQLTVAGGSVTDVSVVQYPSGNPRDEEINSYALPVLIQETLDQQSAQIDMVSGATVTSNGYVESLQSALDQAGV